MSATDDGGFVFINGANHNKELASIGVTDDGESGLISVKRYDHRKQLGRAELKTDQHGGVLSIYGKTDDKSRVVVGISEHGHGAVSTWDKNLYRQ